MSCWPSTRRAARSSSLKWSESKWAERSTPGREPGPAGPVRTAWTPQVTSASYLILRASSQRQILSSRSFSPGWPRTSSWGLGVLTTASTRSANVPFGGSACGSEADVGFSLTVRAKKLSDVASGERAPTDVGSGERAFTDEGSGERAERPLTLFERVLTESDRNQLPSGPFFQPEDALTFFERAALAGFERAITEFE